MLSLLRQRLETPPTLAPLRSALEKESLQTAASTIRTAECQYASETYRRALDAAGLQRSMSAVSNPYHNAQAESFARPESRGASISQAERHSRMWPNACPGSLRISTTPNGCTWPLSTCRQQNLKPNSPARRLSLKCNGPINIRTGSPT